MNPLILGGLLRNFYDDFSMNNFDDRLRLQKLIYLLKVKGFNLGYRFNLYLYGPYSKDLTKDGFQIEQIKSYKDIPKASFPEENIQIKFNKFVKELGNKKNDIEWLEIVSSYLFIKRNLKLERIEEIIPIIKNKRTGFDIKDKKMKDIISKLEPYFVE